MKFSELTECPFCGSEEFYTKDYARGPICCVRRYDGEEADNTEMYNWLRVKEGSNVYCYDCNEYIGNSKTDTVGKAAEKALRERERNVEN